MVRRAQSPSAFAELLTLADVDELVTTSGLRTPAFRLVKGGKPVPASAYTVAGQISGVEITGLASPRKVLEAIDDGATLVLQGMHRYRAPLRAFCRSLEDRLGAPTQVNAYFTPPGSRGLAVHTDSHDVFVLQCFGSKRWEIHAPDGVWDLVLEPGDALYMPQGTPHAATAQDALSGHLTVGLLTEAIRGVLRSVVATLLEDEAFEQRLPVGWQHDPAQLATLMRSQLDELASRLAKVEPEEVVQARIERFLSTRPSALAGTLLDRTRLAGLDQGSRVRRRGDALLATRVEDDRLVLMLGDRAVRMPAWVEPAVLLLADGQEHRVGDVPVLDDEGRLVLVRRLVREGLLEVAG